MTLTKVPLFPQSRSVIEQGEMQTILGTGFCLLAPREDDIHIEAISIALGRICRFNGHSRDFYSVAQHSVLCAYYISHVCHDTSREELLAVLMHDAHEAYSQDIIRPIKKMLHVDAGGGHLANYRDWEAGLMMLISKKFGYDSRLHQYHQAIYRADTELLCAERFFQMRDGQWGAFDRPTPRWLVGHMRGWGWQTAANAFYSAFLLLSSSSHEALSHFRLDDIVQAATAQETLP